MVPLQLLLAKARAGGRAKDRKPQARTTILSCCESEQKARLRSTAVYHPHITHILCFFWGKKKKLDGQVRSTPQKGPNHLSFALLTSWKRHQLQYSSSFQNTRYRSSKHFPQQYHWKELHAQTRIPTYLQDRDRADWDRGTHRWGSHGTQASFPPHQHNSRITQKHQACLHRAHIFHTSYHFSRWISQVSSTYLPMLSVLLPPPEKQ